MTKQLRGLLHVLAITTLFLSLFFTGGQAAEFNCAAVTEIPQAECVALVALYQSAGGAQWTNRTGWLSSDPSGWAGVVVESGKVTKLYLQGNNLTGSIPTEIGSLTGLTVLNLGNNHLTGAIPAQIGSLTKLEQLYLWQNQLSGSIPSDVGNLTQLQSLSFWNNRLSGPIPASLGNLTQLTELHLAQNNLTGSIPTSFGQLTKLQTLALYNNSLTGPIPDLSSLTQLTGLYLEVNGLNGPIPAWLGSLGNLTHLHLMANRLSGPIPPELGNLTNLTFLGLRGNDLTGGIPVEICDLTLLTTLDLSYSHLTGSIPGEIGQLTQLTGLFLSGNHLSGPIPPEIGSLVKLTDLKLDLNDLTDIPASLVNLTNMKDPTQGPYGEEGLLLGYNRLNVDATLPTDLQQYLQAKDPDWKLTQAVPAAITNQGGEITSRDDATTVTVPAEAVSSPLTMELKSRPVPSEDVGSLNFANKSFEINALNNSGQPLETFSFVKPVTVTLQYTDADVQGLHENSLLLYYWNIKTQTWDDAATTCNPQSVYQRDTLHNTVTVSICHLSEFALLGNWEQKMFIPAVIKK